MNYYLDVYDLMENGSLDSHFFREEFAGVGSEGQYRSRPGVCIAVSAQRMGAVRGTTSSRVMLCWT